MKVLVTGAGGFIGSHVTESLVRKGHAVRALAQYNSTGSSGWLRHCSQDVAGEFELLLGDIRDRTFVESVVRGADAVVHLAALIGIPYSYIAPDSYVSTNVQGTLNLLNAAREAEVQHFIHTSTSEVYGSATQVPMTERHALHAQSPYAASKIAADQLALSYFNSFQTPVTILRPFNTFGPRQSLRAIIPTIMTQIIRGSNTIQVGSTWPTRDFTFVTDTASAYSMVLETEDTFGEVINLGTGYEVSVGQLADLISSIARSQVRVVESEARVRPKSSEVERLLSDNSKARRLLGWVPEYSSSSGLERGLREAFAWFSDASNLAWYGADGYAI